MATELYTEEWRPVVGFEGIYEVSSCGRIRRVANGHGAVAGRMLSPNPNKKGYLRACLCRDGKAKQGRVHTLVAEAFIGPRPEGCEVDHIDGNRQNNAFSNLRCVDRRTNAENHRKAHSHSKTGLIGASFNRQKAKYVAQIKTKSGLKYLGQFDSAAEAHAAYVSAKRIHHQGNTL